MTCPAPTTAQLEQLRAELAAELARSRELENTTHCLARAVAELTAHLGFRAATAPAAAPASRSASVTEERDASRSGRHASRVTRHAPGVTDEQEQARQREKAAARSRAYRMRKRSVTVQRDGVTPYVMKEEEKKEVVTPPPPSLVTQASVTPVTRDAPPTSGRLRLEQQVAARRTRLQVSASLPPEVQALREGWERLVVGSGRGFAPWPTRTSARLLQDALAALERRPLEEWLRVLTLVPRSPVCRGELKSRRRLDLLWLLAGSCGDGHEPAEKLLTGAWTVDPEASPPASGEEAQPEPLAGRPPGESGPADEAWRRVLASVGQARRYTLEQLQPLRPRELADGVLVLLASDRFRRDWVAEHYGELLRQLAGQCGLAGVHVDVEASP